MVKAVADFIDALVGGKANFIDGRVPTIPYDPKGSASLPPEPIIWS